MSLHDCKLATRFDDFDLFQGLRCVRFDDFDLFQGLRCVRFDDFDLFQGLRCVRNIQCKFCFSNLFSGVI